MHMQERTTYEVTLSLGSWVQLAALLGLTSGLIIGVVSAVFSAFQGEWVETILTLIISPPLSILVTGIYAFFSYPIYKYLAAKTPMARTLEGTFLQIAKKTESNAP